MKKKNRKPHPFDDLPKHVRLIARLRRIAKEYGARLYIWTSDDGSSGQYCMLTRHLFVARDLTYRQTVSAFFHELCHFLDHRDGIFKRFYSASTSLKDNRFLALRAELHTDNRAQKLTKEYFPKLRYVKAYRSKQDITFLMDYYKDGRIKKK